MLRRGPAKLKDVAEATGLSINTVSLALRGSPRVPESTSLIVASAAKKLNYLPNTIARSLAERKSRIIGVVVTDLMNPILTASAKRLEMELSKSGYRTLIWGTNRVHDSEVAALNLLRSGQVDGLIVYPFRHSELGHLVSVRRQHHPIVLLAGQAPGIDTITSDDRIGARKATEHLIGAGHRAIAFLGSPGTRDQTEKREGYQEALNAAGLEEMVMLTEGFGPTDGRAAMDSVRSRWPGFTAVLASSDYLAIGVLRWARDNGVRVPQDLAVIGFDDIELAPFAEVALTTVAYAADRVAQNAVARLMDLISARDRLPDPTLVAIEPQLVIRDSA